MDLTHWVAVAERELAATGATAQRHPAPGTEPLTSQETRVAILTAQGMTNKEIGGALFLSPKTARNHVSNILGKLGVETRGQAAAAYRSQGR